MTVELAVNARSGGLRFAVRVKPRSSRSSVLGITDDGALSVALKAAPVGGAANEELVKLLARKLGITRRDVTIATGAAARRKLIDVRGIDRAELLSRIADASAR